MALGATDKAIAPAPNASAVAIAPAFVSGTAIETTAVPKASDEAMPPAAERLSEAEPTPNASAVAIAPAAVSDKEVEPAPNDSAEAMPAVSTRAAATPEPKAS